MISPRTTLMRSFLGTLFALGITALPLAFAHASGTASVTNISPGTTVNVGTTLTFSVPASGFTNPNFLLYDPFKASSLTNADMNPYSGNVTWTPITSDVGTHTIQITIHDSLGNSTTVSQTITVNPAGSAALYIPSLGPTTTVAAGHNISFLLLASDFSNSSPTYTVSDSFAGSSVTSSNVSAAGDFSWVPAPNDVGTHVITISARDYSGKTASTQEQITVTASGSSTSSSGVSLGVQSLSTASPSSGQNVTFSVLTSGFTNPAYALSDSFSGSTITNSDITSSGNFSWTPAASDAGTHTITIHVSDSLGHFSSISQTLNVGAAAASSASLVIGNMTPGTTVPSGTPLTFIAVSTSLTSPTYTLSDTFGGSSLANADITALGSFTWTPTASDVGSHTITVTGRGSNGTTVTSTIQIIVTGGTTTTTATDTGTAIKPAYTFDTTLMPGTQSEGVNNLQMLLTQYGLYSGPITGYFGSLTKTSVESFQTAHGISSIGTVGPQTLAALNQLAATTPPLSSLPVISTTTIASTTDSAPAYNFTTLMSAGSTGADVTALQNKLTALGMYSGPITGYFGSLTKTALEAFQTTNSISPVGYTGPATRSALNN